MRALRPTLLALLGMVLLGAGPAHPLGELPPGPHGDAMRLGSEMVRAAQDGDWARARALREQFLSAGPHVLREIPWPPLMAAVAASGQQAPLDGLRFAFGEEVDLDDVLVVFWVPRRGDMQPVLARLDAWEGGPKVVAVAVDPSPSEWVRIEELADAHPDLSFATMTVAHAEAWSPAMPESCLQITGGELVDRFRCASLVPAPPRPVSHR